MSSATTPIRLKSAADLGVTKDTVGLGSVENKSSATIRAEIVAADLAGTGKAFTVLPASGATVGATIGVNFTGQFTTANIANFFAAKVITAGIIDVTDLFAQAISVTDTVKVGSDTGRYLLTLDGRGTASPIAIIDKQNAGALVFGFDSDDKPYFGGGLRDGAIDSINVFTDEVLTQLKPVVVGSTGGIFKVAGLPSMIGATLNKTVTVTPANPSSVLIGLSFSDYFLNIASSVNLNFTPPKYMVTITRSLNGGTATTIHSQMYTGTALNQRDPEVNKWECSFAINVDIAISDINHAANNNDSITYTFTVTRSSGSYSAAKITAASCSQQTQGGGTAGVASQLTAPYVGLTASGNPSYPAMTLENSPTGASGWIRTPTTGLLPYASGGGSSNLGTSSWPFATIYGQAVYDNNNRVYSASNTNIGTGASNYAAGNHTHAYAPLTGGGTSGTWGISVTGNAATATVLQTARTISLTGGVTGSVSFNGSANVSITATVADDSHKHDGRYYTESEIQASSISMRSLFVNPNGVPSNNLGAPTIAEMVFDGQFANKTEGFNVSSLYIETSTDGVTWSAFSTTDAVKAALLTGDTEMASLAIPYGTVQFRLRFRATSYVYLNALYAYWSGNSHSTKVHIYKKHDSGALTAVATSDTTVSSWPGHLYLPFPTISFSPTASLGMHFHEYMIVFIPSWNPTYPSNGISLYKVQTWGGYPFGKRNLYGTDRGSNAIFPASVTANTFYGQLSGNAATATTLQTARTIAISGAVTGTATSFNGGANITIAATALNASNLSAGTVPDARISGSYTGMVNLTGSGTVDFAKFLGNASDTASAPSFSWTGDTNTGIYQPAADKIGFATGGVSRGVFDSAGLDSLRVRTTGTGNDYNSGGVEIRGNGTTDTVYPTLGFHQPGKYAASIQLRGASDFRFYAQGAAAYANVTAGNVVANGTVHANGGLVQNGNVILNGSDTWLRTTGATGWHSATYGGGMYMSDTTWVRTYGGKKFFVENSSDDAIYTSGGVTSLGPMKAKSWGTGNVGAKVMTWDDFLPANPPAGLEGVITANWIAAGVINARHLQIDSMVNNGGVYTSFKIQPEAAVPLRLSTVTSTGALVEDIFSVDRAGNGFFKGILSKDTVDINSIQEEARRQINPYYLGTVSGNKQENTTYTGMASGASFSLPAISTAGGVCNLSFKFATGDYKVYGSTPPLPANPEWKIEVFRGTTAGTLVFTKNYTGSVSRTPDGETGIWEVDSSLSIEGSFSDSGAADSQVYVVKVTYVAGSPTTLYRRYFGGESPNFLTNSLVKATNGYWKDKETGFIIQWGSLTMTANQSTTVTLPIAFPNAILIALADNMEQHNNSSPTHVYSKSKTSISLINSPDQTTTVQWMAYGY